MQKFHSFKGPLFLRGQISWFSYLLSVVTGFDGTRHLWYVSINICDLIHNR